MKNTAGESADLKMALKHDPETPELAAEAYEYPQEADEAIEEVRLGYDTAAPDSWVANHATPPA
jgi:hypothetical protein